MGLTVHIIEANMIFNLSTDVYMYMDNSIYLADAVNTYLDEYTIRKVLNRYKRREMLQNS